MQHKVIFAGFGGQGVMFAGKLVAQAAMMEGKQVAWLPSYGPEMRGGTANCHVTVSDASIGAPFISHADSVVAMNGLAFDKFENTVVPNGRMIVNSTIVTRKVERSDINAVYIPVTDIALEEGSGTLANMVAVGQFVKQTNAVSLDSLIAAMRKIVPSSKADLADLNEKMIRKGYEFA